MLVSFQQKIMNSSLKELNLDALKAEIAEFVIVFQELLPDIHRNL